MKKKDKAGKKMCKGTRDGTCVVMEPKQFDRAAYEAINPPKQEDDPEPEDGDQHQPTNGEEQ